MYSRSLQHSCLRWQIERSNMASVCRGKLVLGPINLRDSGWAKVATVTRKMVMATCGMLPPTKDQEVIQISNVVSLWLLAHNNCDKYYIGKTKRRVKTRFKEHVSHIKNIIGLTPSAIAITPLPYYRSYYFKFKFENLNRNCKSKIFKCLGNPLCQLIK